MRPSSMSKVHGATTSSELFDFKGSDSSPVEPVPSRIDWWFGWSIDGCFLKFSVAFWENWSLLPFMEDFDIPSEE